MRVIFAKTRTSYDSYTDYRTLIEKGWKDICYIDEIKMTEPVIYIVSPINGEFRPHINNHRNESKRCKILWWNLERPPRDEKHTEHKKEVKDLLDNYVDYMLVSDRWYKTYYGEFGDRIIFHPMGIDKSLCENPWVGHNGYDFAHMSYVWGRRDILIHLPNCLQNCWGDPRRDGLLRTKFLINIHQDQYKILEPLRFVLGISHGVPILSETINDPFPLIVDQDFLMCSYEHVILNGTRYAKESYTRFHNMAKSAYDKMIGPYGFVKGIEELGRKLG